MSNQTNFGFSDLTYIIPVKNEELEIQECLRSIRAEEQLSKIIVIDDHSTDSTRANVLDLNFQNVEVIQSQGQGVAEALNTGLAHSRTRFCVRLDADDRNLKRRGKFLIDTLNKEPASLVFTSARIKPNYSNLRRPSYFRLTHEKNLKWLLLVSNVILHPSVCIDREYGSRSFSYPNESGVEDYLLWIRVIGSGGNFRFINRKCIIYNRATNATSSLGNRTKKPLSKFSIDAFMDFQISILGKSDRYGAEIALSGGGFCESLPRAFSYFLHVIWKAPLRAKPNLFFNCAIMIFKCVLFIRLKSRQSRRHSKP